MYGKSGKSHFVHGQTHYKWPFAIANCYCSLPEGATFAFINVFVGPRWSGQYFCMAHVSAIFSSHEASETGGPCISSLVTGRQGTSSSCRLAQVDTENMLMGHDILIVEMCFMRCMKLICHHTHTTYTSIHMHTHTQT